MISSGLHEAHSWSPRRIAVYLAGRPGVTQTVPHLTTLAERGIALGTHLAAPERRNLP